MNRSYILVILVSVLTSTGFGQKTIALNKGWNNIGALSNGLPADELTVDPPGIIASSYFGYNGGYFAATELEIGLGYWVKTTEAGSLTFINATSDPCGTMIVGYGGKVYHTVDIGGQCWMKENLDIGTRVDGSTNQQNNATIEKYCYDDDPVYCAEYGGLYQWNEAMQYNGTPGSQGICPLGWHPPTYAEVSTLATFVSSDGNALKEVGEGTGLGAGTNTSGFSALLSGERTGAGSFTAVSSDAYLWTSDLSGPDPYFANLVSTSSNINAGAEVGSVRGFSVRCIQN
jgi:uncharacterized protein (TIGR02145 family)